MRTKLAGAVAAGLVLVAGLVLAGEPVDWSKAFQRRTDDFDWSRVTNRTSAPPSGPVDWSREFGKQGGVKPAAPAAEPASPAEVPALPRAKAPRALPEQTIEEPAPAPKPAPAPAKPAPPAAPAKQPAPVLPAPTPTAPPAPAPAVPPAPPAAQAEAPPAALVAAAPEPAAPAPIPAVEVPRPAPAAPTAPPAPVPAVPPAAQAVAPAAPAATAPEPAAAAAPAAPREEASTAPAEKAQAKIPSPPPAAAPEPPVPTPARAESPAPPAQPAPALQAAAEKPAPPATQPPTVQTAPPVPAAPPAPSPAQAEVAPAKPAPGKAPTPAQVAAAEHPKPGPLFPKKGFSDDHVAHFLAAALPVPDAAAPGRPRLLTRWSGPVRLQVAGRGSAGAEAKVREAVDEIAAALAQEGRVSLAEASPANLQVFVLPSGPGEAPGYVQNAYDGAVITGSKVVLYANRASRAAVLRLLLEALGLPGRATAGSDSVLASAAPAESGLTALDRSALALLYNPVLAPGMDAASARQAAGSLR